MPIAASSASHGGSLTFAVLAASALVLVAVLRLHVQAPSTHTLSAHEQRTGGEGDGPGFRKLGPLLASLGLPGGTLIAVPARMLPPTGDSGPAQANTVNTAAPVTPPAAAAKPERYLPAWPCNVIPDVPTKGWKEAERPRNGMKDKEWVCRKLTRPSKDKVWYSPRRYVGAPCGGARCQ